jgi:hypothetical protein
VATDEAVLNKVHTLKIRKRIPLLHVPIYVYVLQKCMNRHLKKSYNKRVNSHTIRQRQNTYGIRTTRVVMLRFFSLDKYFKFKIGFFVRIYKL